MRRWEVNRESLGQLWIAWLGGGAIALVIWAILDGPVPKVAVYLWMGIAVVPLYLFGLVVVFIGLRNNPPIRRKR